METGFDRLSGRELLAVIDHALDALTDPRHLLDSDRDRLDLLAASLRVAARLQAWQAVTAARIDTDEAAWRAHGTSTATWLADSANPTVREAQRLIHTGHDLHQFPILAAAATDGAVLAPQAEAITSVLRELPDDLPAPEVDAAQHTMVSFAATYNSTELRRLARHLLDVVDPAGANQNEQARLERDHRIATRTRHLTFTHDHHGSLLIKGSLPVVAAEPLVRIIDAYAAASKRALDALDPQAEYVTPAMRRADALLAMAHHHTQQALAPSHGGDRPRISLTLNYDTLQRAATDAGLLIGHLTSTGEPVPAGQLRQLLCDADLLPAVLGGDSEILDVGRAQRLVTGPIRTALDLRDGGCVFPGCDKPPAACHAHHLIPWWAGGPTCLQNLILVCPHHHGIVEPGHDPTADRWKARLNNAIPEIIPPLRVDPRQHPRRHARFTLSAQSPPVHAIPRPARPAHSALVPAH